MEHIALYRQFRPMNFDEIVEQDGPVSSLRQAVKLQRIGHAYLFSGQRGTGKTSIAKVFSRAVNCESPINGNPCNQCAICKGILSGSLMDVIEIDAASNNSVDNIRRICEEVSFAPSKAKYKVYIIDEVHMLTGGAFNALLKTLEEPPKNVIFLFATTEPHKIPATILSRCQRYDFKRITIDSIAARLKFICDKEGFKADPDALTLIASLSDGAMRDAVSLLDQTGNSDPDKRITRDNVLAITGTVDDAFLGKMAKALLEGDFESLINLCEELANSGRDIIRFSLDLAGYFRDLMVVRMMPDPTKLVKVSSESLLTMYKLCENTAAETLAAFISKLSSMISDLKWSPSVRTSFEISLIQLCGRKVKVEPVPLVIPDYLKKQAEFAAKKALEAKAEVKVEEVKAEEKTEVKPEPAKDPEEKPKGILASLAAMKTEEKKDEPAKEEAPKPKSPFDHLKTDAAKKEETKTEEPKAEEPKEEKKEETKTDDPLSKASSILDRLSALSKSDKKEEATPVPAKKEEAPVAPNIMDDLLPPPPFEDDAAPAPASDEPVPPPADDMIPPPDIDDVPPAIMDDGPSDIPDIPAAPVEQAPKEEIDPEDLPMENQLDLFSLPDPEPAKPVKEEKPAKSSVELEAGGAPLLDMLSASFLDDIIPSEPAPAKQEEQSEPTITHYDEEEEAAEEPKGPAPSTSLVQLMEGQELPTKKRDVVKAPPAGSAADVDALWQSIISRVIDDDYMMYIELNGTAFHSVGDSAYIVFDNSYTMEMIKDLTAKPLYKKIRNDIMTVIPGTRHVYVATEKQFNKAMSNDKQSGENILETENKSKLDVYLNKAEQLGIDIHFGDD